MQFLRAQGADRMALARSDLAADCLGDATVLLLGEVVKPKGLSRDQRLREAAVLCFSESYSNSLIHLLNAKQWKKLLHWLDVSGLALYFLDRMTEIHQRSSLPALVVNRLEGSLEENRKRTHGLIAESASLQQDFQSRDLSYAVMKGLSLCPVSVARLELRHQFDLDFLIASRDAPAAKEILEQHGYALFAISGKSWEFKKGQTPRVGPKDLYRDLPYRGVELHLEVDTPGMPSRLDRTVTREIHGSMMPMLSPVDLFVGQAMHASKDIASPFLRASHLLEFYRHVLARRDDISFWENLHLHAREDRRACVAIGMVTHLTASIWGNCAPQALTSWTVQQLPPAIRLWLDLYGRAAVIQVPPGNKRHLWLREELAAADSRVRGLRKTRLLSFGLPRAVIQAIPGETLSTRVARYSVQLRFFASRVRFHVQESLRFIVESRRWNALRSNLP